MAFLFMYCVYILFSFKLDRFYIGTTDNIDSRLAEHNNSEYPDAFTTRGIPWELFLIIENLTSSQAYAIEKHIKKMKSKIFIKNLKTYPRLIDKLKETYVNR